MVDAKTKEILDEVKPESAPFSFNPDIADWPTWATDAQTALDNIEALTPDSKQFRWVASLIQHATIRHKLGTGNEKDLALSLVLMQRVNNVMNKTHAKEMENIQLTDDFTAEETGVLFPYTPKLFDGAAEIYGLSLEALELGGVGREDIFPGVVLEEQLIKLASIMKFDPDLAEVVEPVFGHPKGHIIAAGEKASCECVRGAQPVIILPKGNKLDGLYNLLVALHEIGHYANIDLADRSVGILYSIPNKYIAEVHAHTFEFMCFNAIMAKASWEERYLLTYSFIARIHDWFMPDLENTRKIQAVLAAWIISKQLDGMERLTKSMKTGMARNHYDTWAILGEPDILRFAPFAFAHFKATIGAFMTERRRGV